MDVPPSSKIPALAWIVIPAAVLVALTPSLRHGFYQDDFTWLLHSQQTRGDLAHVFDSWVGTFKRPLGQFWFYLEYRGFGLRPVLFNLMSLALHAAAVVLAIVLAERRGLPPRAAMAGGLLFGLGAAHGNKPVLWACSQPILLGTVTLLLCLWGLARWRGAHRFWALLLLALTVASHDVFVLVPFGVALVIWEHGRTREEAQHRIALASTAAVIGLVQIGLTLQARAGMMETAPPHVFMVTNFLQYLTSLIAPLTSLRVPQELLEAAGARALFPAIRWLVWIAGALVGVFLVHLARTRRGEWSYLALGALLAAPATVPRTGGPDWVDARYIYPTIALWAPLFVGGLLTSSRQQTRSTLTRVLRGSVLVIACIGALLGSAYMQRQAIANGEAGHETPRWMEIQERDASF